MSLINTIYKALSIRNDANAVVKGKIAQRVVRKQSYKGLGSVFRKFLK